VKLQAHLLCSNRAATRRAYLYGRSGTSGAAGMVGKGADIRNDCGG
jgi:hypothetical protein